MLVSLSISNFRSFLSEETFSLVASKRLAATHPNHIVPIPNSDESVLRTAVIYGANGAGKSNLFRALRYVQLVGLRPNKKNNGSRRERFDFSEDSARLSTFDVQFIANEKLYRFGFKCDDSRINEEWLVEVIGGRERVIYERVTHSDGRVEIEAPELEKVNKKISAIITIGGPQNQSFLSTINATLESEDFGDDLSKVIEWFAKDLNLIAPNQVYAPLAHELVEDSKFLRFAGDFLKSSATGIDHLITDKKEMSEEELKALVPSDVWNKFIEHASDADEGEMGLLRMPNGDSLIIEKTSENHFYKISVRAAHRMGDGRFSQLDLKEESDGTRRLLDLVPALHYLHNNNNGVYFIDEIDRSMHPMLVRRLIEFFLASCTRASGQLIVTTHESTLLDLDLLRRDEIWFAEKDGDLETKIYSLMDFKVRTDLDIRKNYLNGRFGAIPFLGDWKALLKPIEESAHAN
ncbi:AAA family ATPase [Massilia antarctica]|uniref:AAA family ATPase n=1 Tax=Massilia antarctica TaxID=2765360 RepID=UPI0006BD45BF|nr:AAA family ATPase [Massilia sp. H27-R4]MCY0912260.1 AAA family ATPase [Massilia sp. H27-R4]CUI06242.1 Transporter [Janthinobacterium sp. CG23_2]CUU30028.1 Transporter [Janthinobacterium sp. CG23_2]